MRDEGCPGPDECPQLLTQPDCQGCPLEVESSDEGWLYLDRIMLAAHCLNLAEVGVRFGMSELPHTLARDMIALKRERALAENERMKKRLEEDKRKHGG